MAPHPTLASPRARWRDLLAPTTVAALGHAVWIATRGPRFGPDSHAYSRWADRLVDPYGFDVLAFVVNEPFTAPLWMYSTYLVALGIAKVIAGTAWPAMALLLNWSALVVLTATLGRLALALTGSPAAVWGVALGLLAAPDVLLFSPFIATDIVFAAQTTIVLAATLLLGRGAGRDRRLTALAVAVTLSALLTRPTGPALLAFLMLARAVASFGWRETSGSRYYGLGVAALAAVLLVQALVIIHGVPDGWPAPRAWIEQVREGYRQGVVIFDRPATSGAPADTMLSAVFLSLRKWAWFFAIWVEGYSPLHVVVRLAFFLPVYGLACLAVLWSPDRQAIRTLLLFVGIFSLFHAVQEIDFDHRYRIPIVPALLLLAALGGSAWRHRAVGAGVAATVP